MKRFHIIKIERHYFKDYLNRAEEFHKAMDNERIFEKYNASALLGIHASISLTDSLTIFHSNGENSDYGIRSSDNQHEKAAELLKHICDKMRIKDPKGIKRLRTIIGKKNDVAYGKVFRAIDTQELQDIRLDVDRYFKWAYQTFKKWGKTLNNKDKNDASTITAESR